MARSLKHTVAEIMPFFKREPLTVAELYRRAMLTESTARRLITKALDDGLLERTDGNKYMIPEPPKPGELPRRFAPADVAQIPPDSGLLRMREIAKHGPVNPYIQLAWAGERA
jgi:hypothetical protein